MELFSPCRWLISLDFDGTLWHADEQPPIPTAFFSLMRRWRRAGVRWGINTGRTLSYLMEDWQRFAPCLPDFVCTCERFVYLVGVDGALRGLSGHNAAAIQAASALQQRMLPPLHVELRTMGAAHPSLKWIIAPSDPLSVEAADAATMDCIASFLQPFIQRYPGVSIQRAGRYMRLADTRFNKGSALAHVAEQWQVENQHILMIGDGHNDMDAFVRFPGAFCAAPADAHCEVLEWLRSNGGYISPVPGVMQILHHWGERAGLV